MKFQNFRWCLWALELFSLSLSISNPDSHSSLQRIQSTSQFELQFFLMTSLYQSSFPHNFLEDFHLAEVYSIFSSPTQLGYRRICGYFFSIVWSQWSLNLFFSGTSASIRQKSQKEKDSQSFSWLNLNFQHRLLSEFLPTFPIKYVRNHKRTFILNFQEKPDKASCFKNILLKALPHRPQFQPNLTREKFSLAVQTLL